MNIEQYLKAMEECSTEFVKVEGRIKPVPRVQAEFGVYDNYRIFLNETQENLKTVLQNSEKFEFIQNIDRGVATFNYKPGIIFAQMLPSIWHRYETGYEQMTKDFISTLTLHPYQKKDMIDISCKSEFDSKESATAIIRSIKDLVSIMKENDVAICLPESNRDYSQMIKYIP